jgi:hypothetical protein
MGRIIEAGYDVLHSDADAVWLADPFTFLKEVSKPFIHDSRTRGVLKVIIPFRIDFGKYYRKSRRQPG